MKTSFSFLCQVDHLKEVRSFLDNKLKDLQVEGVLKDNLILAVDEVCSNAIIHGHSHDEDRHLHLELSRNEDSIRFLIFDVGEFDLESVEIEEDISKRIQNRQKGGLGLLLIRTIMDDVRFYNLQGTNYCSLVKFIK